MKKKNVIIISITILIICIVVVLWTINKFILPIKVKGIIENILSRKTGYNVTIGEVIYLPLNRLYLKDISMLESTSSLVQLTHIDNLFLTFQIWPYLKDRTIQGYLDLRNVTTGPLNFGGRITISLKKNTAPEVRAFLKELDGKIEFSDFFLAIDKMPSNIKDINGVIELKKNKIDLKNTYFKYGENNYNLKASLTDLDKKEPKGIFSVDSPTFTLKGDISFKDDYIEIKKIKGNLFDSPFTIMGDIKLPPDLTINIYGDSRIDLVNIAKLPPLSNAANNLKLSGECETALFFNGRLQEANKAEGSIKLSSKEIRLYDIVLNDVYLDLRLKDGVITTHRFDMRPYQGILSTYFRIDLNKKMLPYTLNFALKDADLGQFLSKTDFIKKDITGIVSSRFLIKGFLSSIDTIHGQGWITVTNGRLWELPLFGGVIELLGLPSLKSITFTEAAGNFTIEQGRISTQNLTFYSDRLNMSASGNVDFNGNLDILLKTQITQNLIEGEGEAVEIANLLLSQTGNYLGNIAITGTLKNPKYKLKPHPVGNIIKKGLKSIKRDDLKEIENVLKGIFQ